MFESCWNFRRLRPQPKIFHTVEKNHPYAGEKPNSLATPNVLPILQPSHPPLRDRIPHRCHCASSAAASLCPLWPRRTSTGAVWWRTAVARRLFLRVPRRPTSWSTGRRRRRPPQRSCRHRADMVKLGGRHRAVEGGAAAAAVAAVTCALQHLPRDERAGCRREEHRGHRPRAVNSGHFRPLLTLVVLLLLVVRRLHTWRGVLKGTHDRVRKRLGRGDRRRR